MASVKTLFTGAVEGDLEGLYKKIDAVNKKSGPFSVLFCVGQFFGWGDNAADPNDQVVAYATGQATVPVPTYFIGGCGAGSDSVLNALPVSKAPLKYLGRAGVATIHGLNVAFLDGTYNNTVYNASTAADTPAPAEPSCSHYTQADVALLKARLQALEGDVDLLLTCEWPRGLTTGLAGPLPEGYRPQASGSHVVAEIVALARPRYHIAGGEALHYARPPFAGKDLGAGPRVTRFIGLAPLANTTKQKALHALGLVPAISMDPEQLVVQPEGCTPSPFELRQAKREEQQQQGQDFSRWAQQPNKKQKRDAPATIAGHSDVPRDPWNTVVAKNMPWSATEQDIGKFFAQSGQVINIWRGKNRDGKVQAWTHVQFDSREAAERALQLNNCEFMGRQIGVDPSMAGTSGGAASASGKPVDGCWFCLGSANADTELVASVGEEMYLALDKGPITPEHVLVVPIDHYPASVALSENAYAGDGAVRAVARRAMRRYLSALRSMYAGLGRELIAFERHLALRNKGGNHCHINAIGVTPAAAKRAKEAFQQAAAAAGFELQHIPAPTQGSGPDELRRACQQAVGGDSEYFMAVLPDGSRLVRPLMRGERWPMALGREVLADLAGKPERADWKACAVAPEEEAQRTERFKALFKPYDPMQTDP